VGEFADAQVAELELLLEFLGLELGEFEGTGELAVVEGVALVGQLEQQFLYLFAVVGVLEPETVEFVVGILDGVVVGEVGLHEFALQGHELVLETGVVGVVPAACG